MRAELWLQIAAYVTWIVCGVPGAVAVLEGRMPVGGSWIWAVSFLAFGAAYTACGGGIFERIARPVQIALLAVQVGAAALLVTLSASGQPAALFVIVAA